MFASQHDEHDDGEKRGRNTNDLGNGKRIPKHGPPEIPPEKFDHGPGDPVNGQINPEELTIILFVTAKGKNQEENTKIGRRRIELGGMQGNI